MGLVLKNNAYSKLAAGINDNETTLSLRVGDGKLFPTLKPGDWFPVLLVDDSGRELCYCDAGQGDALTVRRGQEGTARRNWFAGTNVRLVLSAAALDALPVIADMAPDLILSAGGVSKLAQPLTASSQTIKVAAGHGVRFPDIPDGVNRWAPLAVTDTSGNVEYMRLIGRAGDTLTVLRKAESTLARAFDLGSLVDCRITTAALEAIQGVYSVLDFRLSVADITATTNVKA